MQETGVRSLGWEGPWRRKRQPTPVFLPGNPMDGGAWWALACGVAKESETTTKQLSIVMLHLGLHLFKF